MFPLKGFYDLHVHPSPDVKKRKFTDPELATRLAAAEMGGVVLKNHFSETACRAALLQEQFPQLKIAGGIVLNRPNGGINPYAVQNCIELGGKFLWMPTLDARKYQLCKHPEMKPEEAEKFLYLLDEAGNLLPAVREVLQLAAEADLTVATGLISAEEGKKVVAAARKAGVKKIIVTHADNPADFYSDAEQLECVKMGAVIEHCCFNVYNGQTSVAELARQIRLVGCGHVLLSSDFGQPGSPYPDEGLSQMAEALLAEGFTVSDIEEMMKKNPEKLLGTGC